ncbi:zinc finger, CCHC-type, Gag-polypeptide of LTR copia-type [Artemisia annua]|uniref:Zinc finger, CCHC-type, Gag-polypeptide of LTR copia-type n=1 Tax=Artemisia annua TaxID=35608 RepID=A0A2U1PK43_ARTAN|nr:zinc finger, CCHC-type, Gag-polypeptide of LTR copia-type [Artemisia annua]
MEKSSSYSSSISTAYWLVILMDLFHTFTYHCHHQVLLYDQPAYVTWSEADQRALFILQSCLSEEAMSEVLGFKAAQDFWCALEEAYSNDSVEHVNILRDSLRQLLKGSSSVSEYGRKFKAFCDQLAAIGHLVDDINKAY